MGPDGAGGGVICSSFLFSCVPYTDLPHEGVTSLLERLARKPGFTIVEDFYKCNDSHKNYRIIRGRKSI
jgi:hypothetical protein